MLSARRSVKGQSAQQQCFVFMPSELVLGQSARGFPETLAKGLGKTRGDAVGSFPLKLFGLYD